ncbi:hypothetical protein SADUNF_Sadunf04G0029700 [Salix dunnii]|uniref:Uncharacterized protein n=1 Tax=Salix dunnii TaxID=1413687 RepID=A0A835K9W4_9ROSI|nr:hypothetical protein SADUNF_Sadunf04G0029700 [Salix dunnii]
MKHRLPLFCKHTVKNHPRKQLQGIRGWEQMPSHANCGGNGKENRAKEEELLELARGRLSKLETDSVMSNIGPFQHKSSGDGAWQVSHDENKNVAEKIGFDLD